MKLEVGQFVRLKRDFYNDDLGIGKIVFIANCGIATINFKEKKLGVQIDNVKKASYNIIDVLEVGDYVNKHEVKSKQSGVKRIDIGENENYVWLYEENIKSVITHEQMEQMAYKVGE